MFGVEVNSQEPTQSNTTTESGVVCDAPAQVGNDEMVQCVMNEAEFRYGPGGIAWVESHD